MSKNFFRKDQQNIPPSFCEGKQKYRWKNSKHTKEKETAKHDRISFVLKLY